MGKVLYLDCSSGASGDMLLGALLDLGLPLDHLREALGDLLLSGAAIDAHRVLRSGISATCFTVVEPEPGPEASHRHRPHHRSLDDVERLIGLSALEPAVRERARALYRKLAEVEAAVHGVPIDRIHFHEVGALDSVVDIVGATWGIARLGIDRVVASPLNVGGGSVETAHGRLSVPAPATIRLLEGVPIYSDGPALELVTPTGALLVASHAVAYGALPPMVVRNVGYGAGTRDVAGRPNVLRAIVGEEGETGDHHRVVALDCNIDDMNPQLYGLLMDRLYAAGALDVFYVPAYMKKNRPGTLVTVIAPPSRREALASLLFAETTTIGVRYRELDRECLAREVVTVETCYGPVRFKLARRAGTIVNVAPEFDDCVRLASERGCPTKDVQAEAIRAYTEKHGHP
ncbi:MAG: nickel pincer cofactor biosynthesis protein LarC [Acidobacteriota bacterium]